jgi:uncharacterized protein YunC (DUF1805 family)
MDLETKNKQSIVHSSPNGRIAIMGSAYYVGPQNRGHDVVVNASYIGVVPARMIADHLPKGAIGIDCGVGPEGVGIAGLWFLEALNIPAAAADVMTVHLGDGVDLYENGRISHFNRPAADCGVTRGMTVKEAAMLLLENKPTKPGGLEVTNRQVMEDGPDGRKIVCTDSIVFGLPEDVRNVLVSAGHNGLSSADYMRAINPFGYVCSDGGKGRDNSGMAALPLVNEMGIAGTTVDGTKAKLGDALSTWNDGIISGINRLAEDAGVRVGMRAPEAARLLVRRKAKDRP